MIESTTRHYSNNLQRLPLGAIKPSGWLHNQLVQQKNGLTGHLDEIWPDVGPESGWLGGAGEKWERGPYYCDGLIPLAYLLNDPILLEKARKWVEWSVNSQDTDGFFGPADNRDWWPRFVMMKTLVQYYEATADERILPMLLRYFKYRLSMCDEVPLADWGKARACDEVLVMMWLYRKTGEAFLVGLADKILAQGTDWTSMFCNFPFTEGTSSYMDWPAVSQNKLTLEERQKLPYFETHVVNVAMGIKHPAVLQQATGLDGSDALRQGIKALEKYHGTANGMFTGDEHLNGRNPSQGTELCAVAEYMYSLENCIETFGGGDLCDLLEKVAFNAYPATITPDYCAHQYVQQVNQVLCTSAKRNWYNNGVNANIFGLEPNFGCCTANMHQGWPKFAQCLWMEKSEDGEKGLSAVSYAPCRVQWDGLSFEVETDYPFKNIINIKIEKNENARTLWLRIPQWCGSFKLSVNGSEKNARPDQNGFIKLNGLTQGYRIELLLAAEVRISNWYHDSLAVERGALLFALKMSEQKRIVNERGRFSDFEAYPGSPWNYALNREAIQSAHITEKDLPAVPFDHESPPVSLTVTARKLNNWTLQDYSASDLPVSPVEACMPEEEIILVPYGCTLLRVAQFPYYTTTEVE